MSKVHLCGEVRAKEMGCLDKNFTISVNPEMLGGMERFATNLFYLTFNLSGTLSILEDFTTLFPKTTLGDEDSSPLGAMDEENK